MRHATRGAVVALLVAAAFWSAPAGPSPHPALTGKGTSWRPVLAATSTRSAFGIRGSIGGLFPGQTRPLHLIVSNPQQFGITVTSIVTTVGAPSSACPADFLQVADFNGSLLVPAGGVAAVSVTATMPGAAPDACQGVTFPLQYSGQGQKS